MSSSTRPPTWHVSRALDHLAQLREHLDRGLDFDDPLLQDAVSMQLTAAIDALNAADSVSDGAIAAAYGPVWPQIIGMRDILTHEYFGVNVDVLEATIDRDLDSLEDTARKVLNELA